MKSTDNGCGMGEWEKSFFMRNYHIILNFKGISIHDVRRNNSTRAKLNGSPQVIYVGWVRRRNYAFLRIITLSE